MRDDARIFLGPIAQRIFGIQDDNLTWGSFKEHFPDVERGIPIPSWIYQMEFSINTAAKNRFPEYTGAVLFSSFSKKFYRPTLSRQEIFLNGLRKFYVMLVEQPPIDFGLHEELGTLLAGLILGARFRFEFIDRRIKDLSIDNSEEDLKTLFINMGNQLLAIEGESAQHGLLEQEALIQCFQNDQKEIIKNIFSEWQACRLKFFGFLKKDFLNDRDAFQKSKEGLIALLSNELKSMNKTFMHVGTKRYSMLVREKF